MYLEVYPVRERINIAPHRRASMIQRRPLLAAVLALCAVLPSRRASAVPVVAPRVSHPPDAFDLEIRRRLPQRLPAVYADWQIDPDTRIITHTPTRLSFAVYEKPETGDPFELYARLVAGSPRTRSELLAVADMGIVWFQVFAGGRIAHLKAQRRAAG